MKNSELPLEIKDAITRLVELASKHEILCIEDLDVMGPVMQGAPEPHTRQPYRLNLNAILIED